MNKREPLAEALDAETQLIWTASGDGMVGKSANLWCAYTGQRKEAAQGWGWLDALYPDDRERVRHLWLQATEHKHFYETWYHLRNAEGFYRPFFLRCMPVLNDDGTLREWVSQIAPSATKEKQEWLQAFERVAGDAEQCEKQELAALVDQLSAVFAGVTEGVTFFDVEGKMLLINAAGRRLLEIGSEIDLTEEPYQNVLAFYHISDEHRQPLSHDQLPLSRILRGEALSSEHALDMIARLPSGREAQLSFSGAPIYDRGGQMIGGVCVYRDVTESRQKERRVQQALNELLTVVEEVSRLPIRADEPTEVAPASSLHTVGQNLAEIIRQALQCHYATCCSLEPQTGKLHLLGVSGLMVEEEHIYKKAIEQSSLSDYLEAEDIARLYANEVVVRDLVTRPYVGSHSDFGIRYRMVAPMLLDEQLVGVLTIGQTGADLIHTPEEIALVKAIAKLVLQVIERVRLTNEWTAAQANELALREVNRRFDAFLSIASHELRTPLTIIKGNVQLALRRMEMLKSRYMQQLAKLDVYEQVIHLLERIHQPLLYATHQASVQERMIGDLLDASRIHIDKLEIVMQRCDLAEIVRQVVEDLRYFASKRLVLRHLPETSTLPILADADRIGQVVNNYLLNALKYSAPERPVKISLESIEDGRLARVAVQDQGSGIASEDLEHIWERFYRSSHATERQYHNVEAGLGLGLYISRTIIEQHGGQVGVESVQGQGSTFWFTLPLHGDL